MKFLQAPGIESPADDQQLERLICEIARGDAGSFSELHNRINRLIYVVVDRVLNNPQDSQDITQEVLRQIWMKATTYDRSKGKPRTWILTIARNRAIDRLRANVRAARKRDELQDESHTRLAQNAIPDPSAEANSASRRDMIHSAVLQLPDKQREAIELVYFAELTQSQAAERLGEPLGTVKARVRRSVKRLHVMVHDKL